MSHREPRADRIPCAVEVVLVDGSITAGASLIDISASGLRVQYLIPSAATGFAVGDHVLVSGNLSTGAFTVNGRIERIEATENIIGLSIVGALPRSVEVLLGAPIGGVPGTTSE